MGTVRNPFAISEWGPSVVGEGDNPTYIQGMHGWFTQHESGLAYESYFDEPGGSLQAALDMGQMPKSSALYASLWSSVS